MLQSDALVGFMPVSQLNPNNYPRVQGGDKNRILEHLRKFIGETIKVKVITADMDDEKLIFSEKEVWEEEQKNVLDSYSVGDIVEGEVSALTSFGAFIKFGSNLEGLVHISEIVWQRISHPREVLKVGDKIKAQIIDLNKSKIYLSIKRLVDDPWKKVKDTYKVGQIINAEVHKIEPFGLMIKLDNEIHGLAHISDLSDKRVSDTKMLLSKFEVGKKYNFEIISIEPAEHRLGLKLEGVGKKEDKSAQGGSLPTGQAGVSDGKEEKSEEKVEDKKKKRKKLKKPRKKKLKLKKK